MVKSLAKRLTYRIMAVVMVMMVIITTFVYYSVREYMLEEAQNRYLGILLRTYEGFRRRLSDVYVAAINNVHDIERDIDHPDMMYDHMERIIKNNRGVKGSAILFKPGYYKDKERFFVPMVRRDSTGRIYIDNTDSANSYHLSQWYKICMTSDSGLWVGTYFDVKRFPDAHRWTMLSTYATPVHDRQGPVGLLCVQMSLESFRGDFMNVIKNVNDTYEKGRKHKSYCFVIDHHGNYIMHPDEKRTLKVSFLDQTKETPDSLDDRVVAKMVNGENGEAMMDVDGVHSWIYYRTLPHVNWTMVIVVPKEVIFHNGFVLNTIILLIMIIGIIVISFVCYRMIRQMTQPLRRFALSADQVAMGNFSSPLPEIKSFDEVRLLHDAFKNMQTSLSIFVDELQKTTTSKASLEHELKIANAIQMAMLPKTFPPFPGRTDIDLYASLTPARDVGGDLYDYFLRDDRLFFCIGDVSGKGVPAALMMAMMRSMFRSETRRADSAAAIVDTMNRNLSEEYTGGYFVTMFVGILDLTSGHLDYCNAGHEPPLIAGHPLPVKLNLPVGALSDWNYEGQQMQLQSGDMLFLYTDGLSEAKNAAGEQFGRKHVQQLYGEHASDTARQLVERMETEVHRHVAEAEQSDDITLLAMKWQDHGDRSMMLTASMDDIGRMEPFISELAQQAGMDGREAKRLRLAAEEAVANIINHGEATAITLKARVEGDQLVLTIDDDGQPFDPTNGSTTDLSVPADQRAPGGLGIMLIHQMANGLDYQRTDGHNVLTIRKNLNSK